MLRTGLYKRYTKCIITIIIFLLLLIIILVKISGFETVVAMVIILKLVTGSFKMVL